MASPAIADFDSWEPWHPREIAERLSGVDVPWCVAAGWALDLFVAEHSSSSAASRGGEASQLRKHEDLEIALPDHRFGEIVDRFPNCDFFVVGEHAATPYPERAGDLYQTWALDRAHRVWRLDVFREPSDGDEWICRRDQQIRLPYSQLIWHTTDGVPCLAPEVALLFKAKWVRLKDEADLAATLPLLNGSQREWLRRALEITHPGHAWLGRL